MSNVLLQMGFTSPLTHRQTQSANADTEEKAKADTKATAQTTDLSLILPSFSVDIAGYKSALLSLSTKLGWRCDLASNLLDWVLLLVLVVAVHLVQKDGQLFVVFGKRKRLTKKFCNLQERHQRHRLYRVISFEKQ